MDGWDSNSVLLESESKLNRLCGCHFLYLSKKFLTFENVYLIGIGTNKRVIKSIKAYVTYKINTFRAQNRVKRIRMCTFLLSSDGHSSNG